MAAAELDAGDFATGGVGAWTWLAVAGGEEVLQRAVQSELAAHQRAGCPSSPESAR
jgi:hypothetical protein